MAKHPQHGGHKYLTSEERAHRRYGKTTKQHFTGPPPMPENAEEPAGGTPAPPGLPAGASSAANQAAGGAVPPEAFAGGKGLAGNNVP